MLNNINLMGRLTKDPECRTTPNGVSVATWYLAVDRDYKMQDGTRPTDFFNCIAWKGTADLARQYLKKGRLITVTGRMEMRDYQDKAGNQRRVYEVNVQSFYFGETAAEPTADPATGISSAELCSAAAGTETVPAAGCIQ